VTTISTRALGRATLDRQLLLRRWDLTVPEALERLVGLQAQTPQTWYVGLWTRLANYDAEPTGRLLESAGVVRMALMRSTIHLVTAADSLWLRPLVEPVIERSTTGSFGRALAGIDRTRLTAAGRAALADRPLTFSELGRALAPQWPDRDPAALAQAIRASVPLVQVTPRGVWGRSGRAAHTPVETWLGRPVEAGATPENLILRYLAAFGPATVRDIQQWCGLTRLAEVADRLRSGLMTFRDEQSRELFDLPDAPRPHPDTPAPVRFLYDFDNLLLSHADRSRVLTIDFADQGFAGTMEQPRTVLIDGSVAATWRIAAKGDTATLTIRPFRTLTATEQEDVHTEATRLLAFTTPKATTHDITIQPPQPR
jgi:winged helix DNA-binding protein